MSTPDIVDALGGHRSGNQWMARCPAHDDRSPSLSIGEADGKILVRCHAGCSQQAVVDALRERRLWNPSIETPTANRNRSARIVAEYDYRDEVGKLLFQVVRFEPKKFLQRQPDGKGGWVWHLGNVRRVPYRLSELIGAPTDTLVFIVEGEKDVETLRAQGVIATCNPGGAGKWRKEYNEHLRDRHVVMIPDADEPGRCHADGVVHNLLPIAASVRRLELLGAKDVSEWLTAGHTADELTQLARHAPLLTQPAESGSTRKLIFTAVGDLFAEPDTQEEWLVDGLLAAGGFCVLAGKPKAGKSTLARNLCKAVAQGDPFLGRKVRQGGVLYLALEEKRSQVRSHFLALDVSPNAPLKLFVGKSPEDALAQLATTLEQEPAALVVIDPLFRFIRTRDGNDYTAMTAALDPVLNLARSSGACVLVTHHAPKGDRADIDAPIGSTAIAGSVDTLLVLKRNDRYRTLSSVQRTGDDLLECVIELDPNTRTVSVGATRQDADTAAMKTAIRDYLATVSEPIDEPTINAAVEGRTSTQREALRQLVREGTLSRTGTGKKGDPYLYHHSRFLVPAICGEQENNNAKSLETSHESPFFPCSRGSADSLKAPEQESPDPEVFEI